MTSVDTRDTRGRILDAAELLFAERGFDGTSLRALTTEAQVNLASVHYHFGNKQGLFAAVFERRIGPVNEERLRLLDEAEARAAGEGRDGRALELSVVLEAFFGPPLRMAAREDPGFRRFLQIVARMHSSGREQALALRNVFHEVLRRFFPAFLRALPHLDERDLYWRLHLLLGSMLALFAEPTRLHVLSDGRCDAQDPEEALRELVTFAIGAMRAPSASPARSPRP